jgi:hypothetical protein
VDADMVFFSVIFLLFRGLGLICTSRFETIYGLPRLENGSYVEDMTIEKYTKGISNGKAKATKA